MLSLINIRYVLKRNEHVKKAILSVNDKLPLAAKDALFRKLVNPYSEHEDKNKVIFVHVPKTAGNSIFQALYSAHPQGHKEVLRYQKFDRAKFKAYYKFCFVRNPWDRFVSAYCYLKKGGMGRYDIDFKNKYLNHIDSFDSFISTMSNDPKYRKSVLSWIHFKPQSFFLCNRNGELMVDYIGYYEKLEICYAELCSSLGVAAASNLNIVNDTQRSDYREYYTDQSRSFIGEIYARDVEMFGYEF